MSEASQYADNRVGPIADAVRTITTGTSQDLANASTGLPLGLRGHFLTIKALGETEVSFSVGSVTPASVAGYPMSNGDVEEFRVPTGCTHLNTNGASIVVFVSSRDTTARRTSDGITK